MPESHDDAHLLANTARDPSAFGRFYDRYEQAVLVYMLRRTASADVAADLTAEVFASALEGAADFRYTGAPPAAWLFRIAHNILVDSYRASRVRDEARRRLAMDPLQLSHDLEEHLEQLALRAEGARALELLGHLPDDQRDAIVRHILEDRDYDDIARELRCSSSVVRKRVSRGLAVLRRQINPGAPHV